MKNKVLENLGALEAGILILDCDIKSELSKLSYNDARRAKRKYRKLLRKVKRQYLIKFGEPIKCKKTTSAYLRKSLREAGARKLQC